MNITTTMIRNLIDTPDHGIKYLALYTGPSGPISVEFTADDVSDANEHIEEYGKSWYDDASDCLGLDPDNETLANDIETALIPWTLVHTASTNSDYSIYAASS